MTQKLDALSRGDALRELFAEALYRVAPAGPTARAIEALELAPEVVLLATGKAAIGMAAGAESALGDRITSRVVVAPRVAEPREGFFESAHPVPDQRSEAAGRALLAAAAAARPGQEILALISGGGSALSAVPAEGLTLADKAQAIARLEAAGTPIAYLNCVRRHLSALKGGRLALASPVRVTTLVVSDVIGDRLAEIASGPTVPDPTSFADACAVVERWSAWHGIPPAVRAHLEAGLAGQRREGLAEGERPGDRAILILGLDALVGAAVDAALARKLDVQVIDRRIEGEVTEVARNLASELGRRGAVVIAGGEPTVVLPDGAGVGGRAHQLALLLAHEVRGTDTVVLVAGSDGMDGNTGAAGAVVDGATWDAISARGLDPAAHLARCDAGSALAAVGAQILTGPTGVNHCDLVLAWAS
jgi:hydroxypyruvate reductase